MNVIDVPKSLTPRVTEVADWQTIVAEVFDGLIVLEAGCTGGFHANLSLGGLRVLRTAAIESARQRVSRRRGCERYGPADELVLMLQCQGTCVIEQDEHQNLLQPGDLVLFDNARPYELTMNERFEQKMVRIERGFWGPLVPQLERLCAQRLHCSSVGRVLASLVDSLATEATDQASDLDSLAPAVVDLVASAFLAPAKKTKRGDTVYARAVQRIQERIWDSTLDPDSLAREQCVSVRYLHRVFHENGHTLMGFVREMRLVACARVLRASPERQGLGRLAERFGFDDDATFRRAFKRRFGLAPSAYARQTVGCGGRLDTDSRVADEQIC